MLERHALRGPVEELHEAAVQLPEVPEDQRLHLAELFRILDLKSVPGSPESGLLESGVETIMPTL